MSRPNQKSIAASQIRSQIESDDSDDESCLDRCFLILIASHQTHRNLARKERTIGEANPDAPLSKPAARLHRRGWHGPTQRVRDGLRYTRCNVPLVLHSGSPSTFYIWDNHHRLGWNRWTRTTFPSRLPHVGWSAGTGRGNTENKIKFNGKNDENSNKPQVHIHHNSRINSPRNT